MVAVKNKPAGLSRVSEMAFSFASLTLVAPTYDQTQSLAAQFQLSHLLLVTHGVLVPPSAYFVLLSFGRYRERGKVLVTAPF